MNFFPADHRPGSQPSKLHVARATASHCFQFANSSPVFHTATIRQDRQGLFFYFIFFTHDGNAPHLHIIQKRSRRTEKAHKSQDFSVGRKLHTQHAAKIKNGLFLNGVSLLKLLHFGC